MTFRFLFQEAKRSQRETSDRLARLEKERAHKHKCDGCQPGWKDGANGGAKN